MPRPTKEDAIRRLQQQLDEIPELQRQRYDSAEFKKWRRDTRVAVAYAFEESSHHVKEFQDIGFTPFVLEERFFQEAYVRGLDSAAAILRSMIDEVQEYWPDDPQEPYSSESVESPQPVSTKRVFLTHGRDHGTRDTVAGFLRKLDLEVVILEEQPDQGLTTIEKFEQNAEGGFVVALLTPDDVGGPNANELKPRARQNVIFELGYFVRAFGRNRVRALKKGDVEIPSNYAGVLYISMDEHGGWRMELIREMKSAGLDIDANLAL